MNINLSELTIENVGQWPEKVKIGLVIFLAMLIIAFGYWFIIKANFEEYNNLQTQEIKLRKEFEEKQYKASNLAAFRQQLHIMQLRFGTMLKLLPSENEMPSLLENISKTGVAIGLNFELFKPLPEVPHDFYIELPINIEVVGTYHQLAVFLSRVAQISRIVTFHDFLIEGANAEKQKTQPSSVLKMKLTAKIYRYRTR